MTPRFRALAVSLFVACWAAPYAWAGSLSSPGQIALCDTRLVVPPLDQYGMQAPANTMAVAARGTMVCTKFRMPCISPAPWTKLAAEIASAGPAGSKFAIAIYDGNSGARLLATNELAADAADSVSQTGLTAANLVPGGVYLACVAQSTASSVTYRAVAGTNTGNVKLWTVLSGDTYRQTAADAAELNAACTGAGAPYTCCTGSGTGTCAGMPTTLPASNPNPYANPAVVIGR